MVYAIWIKSPIPYPEEEIRWDVYGAPLSFDRFNKDNRAQISAVGALRMVGLLVVLMLVYSGIVGLSDRIDNAADIPSDSAWNAHGIDTGADLLESLILWLVLAILFVVLLFGKSIGGGR